VAEHSLGTVAIYRMDIGPGELDERTDRVVVDRILVRIYLACDRLLNRGWIDIGCKIFIDDVLIGRWFVFFAYFPQIRDGIVSVTGLHRPSQSSERLLSRQGLLSFTLGVEEFGFNLSLIVGCLMGRCWYLGRGLSRGVEKDDGVILDRPDHGLRWLRRNEVWRRRGGRHGSGWWGSNPGRSRIEDRNRWKLLRERLSFEEFMDIGHRLGEFGGIIERPRYRGAERFEEAAEDRFRREVSVLDPSPDHLEHESGRTNVVVTHDTTGALDRVPFAE